MAAASSNLRGRAKLPGLDRPASASTPCRTCGSPVRQHSMWTPPHPPALQQHCRASWQTPHATQQDRQSMQECRWSQRRKHSVIILHGHLIISIKILCQTCTQPSFPSIRLEPHLLVHLCLQCVQHGAELAPPLPAGCQLALHGHQRIGHSTCLGNFRKLLHSTAASQRRKCCSAQCCNHVLVFKGHHNGNLVCRNCQAIPGKKTLVSMVATKAAQQNHCHQAVNCCCFSACACKHGEVCSVV